jgi:hypothetical protein
MENIDFCNSKIFRDMVEKSINLTRANHPKEAGFSCWLDEAGEPIYNEPALGEDYSIALHNQGKNEYPQFSGYCEGEGSQTTLFFHTHPGSESEGDESILMPSIADFSCHLSIMRQNRQTAEVFSQNGWVNPIGIIGSPHSKMLRVYQIDDSVAEQAKFDIENLWCKAVWKVFGHYYPNHAKRGTGMTASLYGPNRDPLVVAFLGFELLPAFLNPKRYQECLVAAGISSVLVDMDGFTKDLNLSYKVDESSDDDFEDDEFEDDEFED